MSNTPAGTLGMGFSTGHYFQPGRKGSDASTASNGSSTSVASNAEKQRIRNLEARLAAAELRAARAEAAARAASGAGGPGPTSVANNAYSKYRKMLKVGVPRPQVNQKMRNNGLDPSLLNAPAGTVPVAAPVARPSGPPAFLAGLGGVTLKKTTGPAAPAAANKPKTGAQAAAMGIAEAAAARRAQMQLGNIESRLAASKASKAGPETGFTKFQAELAAKAAAKTGKATAGPKKSRSNAQGELPPGWYYLNDGTDQWYASNSGASQWERPTLKRKNSWSWNNSPKASRKTRRRGSSRRRR